MKNSRHRKLLLLRLAIPLLIGILLSFVITLVNQGYNENFARNWAKGFVVAIIVIPVGIRLIPMVTIGVRALLGNRSVLLTRCVVAVCVAMVMESIVSLAVTLVQRGPISGWHLMWGEAFLRSLPVGLVIGFSMTFIVHPWMSRLAEISQDSLSRE